MSCSKLIINLKPYRPFVHVRQLSSLSEIRQSSMKSKPTATDSIKSDIVVIGDGILANSIAYWLRATNLHNESVTVVESEQFTVSNLVFTYNLIWKFVAFFGKISSCNLQFVLFSSKF